MTRPCLKLALLICAAVPTAALAAERVVILDPVASAVGFTLDTTFHVVHGTMALRGGTIRFNTETGEASGEITVDASRAETGNKGRDKTMHAEVLEISRYPTIVFKVRRVEGALVDPGRSELRIVGVMSLHGTDHPMTMTATVDSEQERVHGELRFPIPYVEWGMKDPSFFVVRAAKTVDIIVRAVGRWDNSTAPR